MAKRLTQIISRRLQESISGIALFWQRYYIPAVLLKIQFIKDALLAIFHLFHRFPYFDPNVLSRIVCTKNTLLIACPSLIKSSIS